jgi:hypothetical protein
MEPLTQETITTEQAKEVHAALEPGFKYLARLVRRMEKTFRPNDPLVEKTWKAYDTMHALMMSAWHYASCQSGVGVAPKEE